MPDEAEIALVDEAEYRRVEIHQIAELIVEPGGRPTTVADDPRTGELDGAVGAARFVRADGSVERLASTARVDMRAGDVFVIETPGGGGFGGD